MADVAAQPHGVSVSMSMGSMSGMSGLDSDVAEFVKALRSEEIVVDTTEGLATPASGNASYAAPTFERFDDMAEMFALDPPLPGLAAKA